MMQRKPRAMGGALLAAFVGTAVLGAPIAAGASEAGRRNTTLGLGAATAYLFTRGGSKVPAFVGAAGTAYAYSQYQKDVNARHRREKAYTYRTGFRRGQTYARYHRRKR